MYVSVLFIYRQLCPKTSSGTTDGNNEPGSLTKDLVVSTTETVSVVPKINRTSGVGPGHATLHRK